MVRRPIPGGSALGGSSCAVAATGVRATACGGLLTTCGDTRLAGKRRVTPDPVRVDEPFAISLRPRPLFITAETDGMTAGVEVARNLLTDEIAITDVRERGLYGAGSSGPRPVGRSPACWYAATPREDWLHT